LLSIWDQRYEAQDYQIHLSLYGGNFWTASWALVAHEATNFASNLTFRHSSVGVVTSFSIAITNSFPSGSSKSREACRLGQSLYEALSFVSVERGVRECVSNPSYFLSTTLQSGRRVHVCAVQLRVHTTNQISSTRDRPKTKLRSDTFPRFAFVLFPRSI